MNKAGKKLLSAENFQAYPIWRFDEETESYFPLINLQDLINDHYDMQFRCIFELPNGKNISGSVCGFEDIYFIRIFHKEDYVLINKNFDSVHMKNITDFINKHPEFNISHWQDFFPLKFQTNLNHSEVKDFSGVFDIQRESE